MMSLLCETTHFSKMPEKRLFEHCGYGNRSFKRPKVDAVRRFPRVCGTLATQVSKTQPETKCPKADAVRRFPRECGTLATQVSKTQPETVRNSKAAEERLPLSVQPFGILLPRDCESVKPLVSPEVVEALEQNNTVKTESPKLFEKGKSPFVEDLGARIKQNDNSSNSKISTKPQLLVTKYPPPKIREGFGAFRKFPPGCGSKNQFSSASKPEVYAHNPITEHGSIPETVETDVNKRVDTFREFPPGCGSKSQFSASKHEVSAHNPIAEHDPVEERPETNVNQLEDEIYDSHGFERKLEGNGLKEIGGKDQDGASFEYEFKEEEDSVEIILIPPLEGNSLQPDCSRRVVSNKVDESKTSHDCVDVVPLFGNNVIAEQQLKCVSNCELHIANADHSTELSIVPFHMKENSHFLVSKGADKFSRELLGDCEKHELAVEESINLSIVPFEDHQAVTIRNKVREALNLFEEIYNNLMREHQIKSNEHEKSARMIHTEAAMVLKKQHKWVNANKKFFGPVPGVEIGDQFHFRVELCIVGLHGQLQAGIDYQKKDGRKYATSIVDSRRYANEVESSEVLIYSGQGGNPLVGYKEPQDQKLERGNLALKHSMDARIPVRVIRSRQTVKASKTIGRTRSDKFEKTYFYDGLYIVTKCWQERGHYGKLVFKFQLDRIPGQPKLTQKEVKRSKTNVLKDLCVVDDISEGLEKMPIRATNMIDDKKPLPFNYTTKMIYPGLYNHPSLRGCDCTDGCSDHEKCSCTLKNEGEIPFNNSGAIIRAKHIVYECGPFCKCPPSCNNRVSQHGVRYQLEIFKTESRGWGLRSRSYISSGSFICEYIGELLTDKEAEQRIDNDEYLFDIGKDHNGNIYQDENGNGFTIDAARNGNVGRFINHSCSPNVHAQEVLYDHDDTRMPHIMLFASRNIPPLRELTYDYNYKVDHVLDVNGNVKKKNCYCGSRECNGRMY